MCFIPFPLLTPIIFCATQKHAAAIRDLINQNKKSTNTDYCVRVTADDGSAGETFLKQFQDNDKTIPTILTTSQKLSTGVDAKNVRAIILLRPVNSIIEFKQIVGRGTRLFDGKDFFTIYDFVEAYKNFSDPEWDGEPLAPEPCSKCGEIPCICLTEPPKPCKVCDNFPCTCEIAIDENEECSLCGQFPCECTSDKKEIIKVTLADGKERQFQHMSSTSYWSADGIPISAPEFVKKLFGSLPDLFKSEDELRKIWSDPVTRKNLLRGLEEMGYGFDQLETLGHAIDATESDIYDILSYIAFTTPTITREERVVSHKPLILENCTEQQKEFLNFVLNHYIEEGVKELDSDKLPQLLELKYGTPKDAVAKLGSVSEIRNLFLGFQSLLYLEDVA